MFNLGSSSLKSNFFKYIISDNNEKVKQLLMKDKSLVDACDKKRNFGLHYVRSVEMLNLLVDNGANVDARNRDGETPIFVAFTPEIALLLRKRGASLNTKNFNSDTLLIKYSRRVVGEAPAMTPEDFLKVWPMLKTSGINPCAVNKDGLKARSYLSATDLEQKGVYSRISHLEMTKMCSKNTPQSNLDEGK